MNINNENIPFYMYVFSTIVGLCLFIVCLVCCFCKRQTSQTTSPVEEIIIVDSLTKVNTKLTIEVEFLDSIKDVEKDKVFNLSNDSTLKLFYELIRK